MASKTTWGDKGIQNGLHGGDRLGQQSISTLEIISGQRAITADTDLRLCRVLGLSPGDWLRAQAAHDTELTSVELAEELKQIQPLAT